MRICLKTTLKLGWVGSRDPRGESERGAEQSEQKIWVPTAEREKIHLSTNRREFTL